MRIGLVAGEASGDLLGAGLIRAIRDEAPDAVFEGVAGPHMAAAGCRALHPMDRLSVMGLVEVLGRYRELSRMRRALIAHFIAQPPDVFVGIDAPDFNLGLEAALKAAGIRTAHYVSPSVWAWRQYRLRKIARAVDLMLTLFPFEARFYQERGIPVRYVGHPLADLIPLESERGAARAGLGLPAEGEIVALLPGSRVAEVRALAGDFVRAAAWCAARRAGLHFVAPLVDHATRSIFEEAAARHAPALPITVVAGRAREAMAAADAVLLASGTATLEALLLKRPMVVAYRLAGPTYWVVTKMLKVDRYALPNLLAGQDLVPEVIQAAVSPERLGREVLDILERPEQAARLQERFAAIHRELRRDASRQAAAAVLELARAGAG